MFILCYFFVENLYYKIRPLFFYFCLCKKTSKTLSQHTFLICKIFLCKTDFDWHLSISYNVSHKRFKTQRKHLKKSKIKISFHSAGNYMFKTNKRYSVTRGEICSNITKKIGERHHWRRFCVFIVNFEHISHLVLMFLMLTLNS